MQKSRIDGIGVFFESTTKEKNVTEELSEKSTKVLFEVPISLKKEINIYCATNEISIKDFITKAIKKELK